ncbi:MAG: hypothetical protein ACR2QG_01585 [Gammaproteobacteria bacterium]
MIKNSFFICAALAILFAGATVHANSHRVAKEVSLIINGKRLVASNIRFSKFDTLELNAQERIREQLESKGVILVITNQRLIAYGVSSGWRDIKTIAGERIESSRVEDFAAFVNTSTRYLNFNGETGIWGKQDRRVER